MDACLLTDLVLPVVLFLVTVNLGLIRPQTCHKKKWHVLIDAVAMVTCIYTNTRTQQLGT